MVPVSFPLQSIKECKQNLYFTGTAIRELGERCSTPANDGEEALREAEIVFLTQVLLDMFRGLHEYYLWLAEAQDVVLDVGFTPKERPTPKVKNRRWHGSTKHPTPEGAD